MHTNNLSPPQAVSRSQSIHIAVEKIPMIVAVSRNAASMHAKERTV